MRRSFVLFALVTLALTAPARSRFSYIYARGVDHGTILKGSVDEIVRLHKRLSGSYLWARLDGIEYLIRDPAILDEVRRNAAPLDALEPRIRALDSRMKPLEQRQDRLERELDSLTDDDDERATAETRARIRQLESELRAVERDLRPLEREQSKLDQREEELDVVFDAEVERVVERAIRSGAAKRFR